MAEARVRRHWRRPHTRQGAPVRGTTVRAHTRRLGGSEHVLTKLALLAVLFVVVSIWVDPEGTAEQVGAFLAGAGRFVLEVLAVAAAFLGSLAGAS